ncbi:hypothetical protein LINGRAHAP2_LOCUS33492 [Linum grandiflorum]
MGFPEMRPRGGGDRDCFLEEEHQVLPARNTRAREAQDRRRESDSGRGSSDSGAPAPDAGAGARGACGRRGGLRDQMLRGRDLFRGEIWEDVRGGDREGVGRRGEDDRRGGSEEGVSAAVGRRVLDDVQVPRRAAERVL